MRHFATPRFWRCYEALPQDVRGLADRCYTLLKTDAGVRIRIRLRVAVMVCGALAGTPLSAAELTPAASAAFDRHASLTEARMAADLQRGAFLSCDDQASGGNRTACDELRRGGVVIRRVETLDPDGRRINVPGGQVHHWVGIVFVPGAPLSRVLALAQDYDRYQNLFPEVVRKSRLVERHDNDFRIKLRFRLSRILTGVVDVESDVTYVPLSASRWTITARSTRVVEIADADTPAEHEYPAGRDNGYVWRTNTYWRLEERDGGTYIESEGLSLSRDVPFVFAWLVNPIVDSLSRNTLQLMLATMRRTLSG